MNQIKEAGIKAGVVLNPATPIDVLDCILDQVDMVLLMTVNPGFGGQKVHSLHSGKDPRFKEKNAICGGCPRIFRWMAA